MGQGDYVSARETFEEGLKHDAGNAALKSGLEDAENRIRAQFASSSQQNNGMMQIGQLFSQPGAMQKVRIGRGLTPKPAQSQRSVSRLSFPVYFF